MTIIKPYLFRCNERWHRNAEIRLIIDICFVVTILVLSGQNQFSYADELYAQESQPLLYRLDSICIDSPWAFNSLGKNVGAVFMVISARENFSDRLVSANSPQANRVEIHDILNENGTMMMRRAEAQTLEFGADSPLILEPHGLHVMLMGLESPLTPQSDLNLRLEFERSGIIELEVDVRELTAEIPRHTSSCD